MNGIFDGYQSPHEDEILGCDLQKSIPRGWRKLDVILDGAIACLLSFGHETGHSEAIILRRLATGVVDWERVKYRRFHKRRRDYPSSVPTLRWQAPLYLTNREFMRLLTCAKRKRVPTSEIVNAICAEHFRPDRKWKWRNMK